MKEYHDYYSQAIREAKQDAIVPAELQIPIPSNDFDKDVNIVSFSIESDNIYTVNLYNMTCTCPDFSKQHRGSYSKDDVRRMCKHLMRKYHIDIGLQSVSEFAKYLIKDEHGLKKYIQYIKSEKLKYPVIVNFDSIDGWWNIYIRQEKEKDEYSKYGYFAGAGGSWYDAKPYGIAGELKLKIKGIQKEIKEQEKQAALELKATVAERQQELPSGCVSGAFACFIGIILLVIILFKGCG